MHFFIMKPLLEQQPRIIAGILLLVLLALAGLLCGFARPDQNPAPLPAAPILDMHCHTAGLGAGPNSSTACCTAPTIR